MATFRSSAYLLLLFVVLSQARLPLSPFPIPGGSNRPLNSTRSIATLFTAGYSADDQLLAITLQGVVNRAPTTTALYRVPSVTSSYMLWLNETVRIYGISINQSFQNVTSALAFFIAEGLIKQYVLMDEPSINTAVAVIAAVPAVAVTTTNEQMVINMGLSLLTDVRGKNVSWAISTFNNTNGFTFSNSVTILQDPAKAGAFMSDYAIAVQAIQWWTTTPGGTGLPSEILRSMKQPFAALGWGPDEKTSVTAISKAGGAMVASDWGQCIDVLSSFDLPQFQQRVPPPPPNPPSPPKQHTVTFLMSDGDNIQFVLGNFALPVDTDHYGSPDRGAVAMGWTISPALVELAPAALHYIYRTASMGGTNRSKNTDGRDVFVAGVSGFGYFYPDAVASSSALESLLTVSGQFMNKANMTIVNVLGAASGAPSKELLDTLLTPDQVQAVMYYPYDDYSGLAGSIMWNTQRTKPLIGGRFNLWGDGTNCGSFCNPQQTVEKLLQLPRDAANPNGYSLIPLHAWSHNVSDVLWIAQQLEARAPGEFAVVAPDAFVDRILTYLK